MPSLRRRSSPLQAPQGTKIALTWPHFGRFTRKIQQVFEEQRDNARGAILSGPIDRLWNLREATLRNRDGYRLVFSRPLDPRLFSGMLELDKHLWLGPVERGQGTHHVGRFRALETV